MRSLATLAVIVLLTAVPAAADTLELADGSLLEGRFVGGNPTSVMFETGGQVGTYDTSEIVALWFSAGVDTAFPVVPATAAATPVVPQGTRLMIRTSDTIDSSRHSAGHRFRGQLEGALVVQGREVVPSGSWVYGRLTQARQAGRVAGSSELTIEFTDIMVGNRLFPISTGEIGSQAGGTGRETAGRTARGAAVGALVGGSSGARTGATIGAGASILTRGASVNIPRGTLLETTLRAPLELQ